MTALLAVALLAATACSDDTEDELSQGGSKVVKVGINTLPNNQSLTNVAPQTTRQMFGFPQNASNNWVDKPVTWASSDPTIVTVDANTGAAVFIKGGVAYIRATAGGVTDSARVTVRRPTATVVVTGPAKDTVRREGGVQYAAVVLAANGDTLKDRTVTWSSADTSIAKVSATGFVTGAVSPVDGATTNIIATVSNLPVDTAGGAAPSVSGNKAIHINGDAEIATITLTGTKYLPTIVNIAGTGALIGANSPDIQLTAVAKSALGTTMPATFTWTSSDPTIITVSNAGLMHFTGARKATATTITVSTPASAAPGAATITAKTDLVVQRGLAKGDTIVVTGTALNANFSVMVFADAASAFKFRSVGPGAEDADLFGFRPSTTAYTLAYDTNSPRICFAGGGNDEQCNVPNAPETGWYRIVVYAYTALSTITAWVE